MKLQTLNYYTDLGEAVNIFNELGIQVTEKKELHKNLRQDKKEILL